MNKTVTINISGIIFHIEEDAFDSLSKYLSTIKGYFSNTDGGNEILADIEARIAELLQGKINNAKQVILMMDVEYVKAVMGKPEDFGGESNQEEKRNDTNNPQSDEKIKRRLFRDPDDPLIGGVCGGLATYFNVDKVWVRLAMFLLIFFGGISLWVYVVLWIIIPLAKTTADKFAMRGESANVNNIIKSFQEEAEDVKARVNKYGKEFKTNEYANSIRGNVANVLRVTFNVLGRFIGFTVFLFGAALLFAYAASLFGISVLDSNTDIAKWKSVIFDSSSDYGLAVIAFIVVCGIPIFLLVYSGIKLMFRIRYSNRWLNRSLGIVWTLGIILGFYVTVVTVKEFSENSKLKETTELHGFGDTIVVKLNPSANTLKTIQFDNEEDLEINLAGRNDHYFIGTQGKKLGVLGFAKLNVSGSSTDSVELSIVREARGRTKKDANENAKDIQYTYKQIGNELIFDELFNASLDKKFRAQELSIKIKLPKGKVIYFDKSTKNLLDDIDNTSNTWDGDMINRRWIMTDKGLKCIDCDDMDTLDDEDEIKAGDITINEKGVQVKGKNKEIKIDENGISVIRKERQVRKQKEESDESGEKSDNF